MTRSFHQFQCDGDQLIGTLDSGTLKTGLLMVSGGNEIRSGAHAGMSSLSRTIASQGYPVFRFDRRGIGDSTGNNGEFNSSRQDIQSAMQFFRSVCPDLKRTIAFGNCDAATAIALFGPSAGIDAYVLANPWVIENDRETPAESGMRGAAAIRSRYWNRIKNPKSMIDLVTGKISISKLFKGLAQATKRQDNSSLAIEMRDALTHSDQPIDILIAEKDGTALAFLASWKSKEFSSVRQKPNITLAKINSASHSFADAQSKKWLTDQILKSLGSG